MNLMGQIRQSLQDDGLALVCFWVRTAHAYMHVRMRTGASHTYGPDVRTRRRRQKRRSTSPPAGRRGRPLTCARQRRAPASPPRAAALTGRAAPQHRLPVPPVLDLDNLVPTVVCAFVRACSAERRVWVR